MNHLLIVTFIAFVLAVASGCSSHKPKPHYTKCFNYTYYGEKFEAPCPN